MIPSLEEAGILTVGTGTYGEPMVITANEWEFTPHLNIGSYCSLGRMQFLLVGEHNTDWVTTYPIRIMLDLPGKGEDGHPKQTGDINVGNDVWIADSAIIMAGVTIGNGAVVAAGSIVTHDVEPYTIVAGIPAKPLRKRFTDEQIEALEKIAWWEWPKEKIIEAVDLLCNPDIEGFIEKYGKDDE